MKNIKKQIPILLIAVFLGNVVFAAFPYKNNEEQAALEQTTLETVEQAELYELINELETTKIKKSKVAELSEKFSAQASSAMDNDLLITLLLWFFLGGLAAHRWYKKKPVGWNILFILTGGGCGIWAIVDLINILTGKF